jgi:trimeric autotransporter adhesin
MKPLNQSKNLLMGLGIAFLTQAGVAQNNVSYTGNSVPILGVENMAVGGANLTSANASSAYNVGIGRFAFFNLVSGVENVAVGHSALGYCTADSNAAGGHFALGNTSTGNRNTAFGNRALTVNTTGNFNTSLGALSNSSANNLTNATAIGYGAIVDASNRIWLGDANVATNDVWSYGTYNTLSDGRFKSNVSESDVKGLAFINLLRPVVYNFEAKKATEFMTKNMPEDIRRQHLSADFSEATAIRQSGFIAQEMAEAAKKSGYKFDGVHVPADAESNVYGIAYGQLVVPLVKAVQEMDQQKTALEQKVEKLEKQVQELLNKTSGTTGINQSTGSAVDGASLEQNIPNPFSNETVISYNLPQQVNSASLVVYDLSGKQITSFPITEKGASSITITSEKLAGGIYIYSVMADGRILDSKRMVVAQK